MGLSNAQLKQRGKAAFKANFWPCVVVTFIVTVFTSLGNISAGSFQYVNNQLVRIPPSSASNLIHLLIGILVTAVLGVGSARFYLNNRRRQAQFSDLLCGFTEGYANIVFVRLIVGIKVMLWSLLLIVPGIIKAFSWSMVPYILSENPGLDHKTAQQRSAEMMQGNKMKLFSLYLSFIGWVILGVATFGIVLVLWTAPYMEATVAEWYAELSGADKADTWLETDEGSYLNTVDRNYY